LNSAISGATSHGAGASLPLSRSSNSTSGSTAFADILVSTTSAGGASDGRAPAQAPAAAAGAAANDVDILAKLTGAFRNGAPDGALGGATIDGSRHVVAEAY